MSYVMLFEGTNIAIATVVWRRAGRSRLLSNAEQMFVRMGCCLGGFALSAKKSGAQSSLLWAIFHQKGTTYRCWVPSVNWFWSPAKKQSKTTNKQTNKEHCGIYPVSLAYGTWPLHFQWSMEMKNITPSKQSWGFSFYENVAVPTSSVIQCGVIWRYNRQYGYDRLLPKSSKTL